MHYYSSGSTVGPQLFSVDIFPGSNSIRHEAGGEGLASNLFVSRDKCSLLCNSPQCDRDDAVS